MNASLTLPPSRSAPVRASRALPRDSATTLPLVALLLVLLACGDADPLSKARSLQDAGRFEDSLPILVELVERGDAGPEALYRYGLALSQTNSPSRAVWPLHEAMETEEWILPAAMVLARDGARTHNYEEAIAAATIVLEREPDNEEALLLRAEARTRTRNHQDYEGALEDADRLLALNPDERRALVPRATALLALTRAEEAGEALEAIAEAFGTEGLETADAPRFCAARAKFATEKHEPERAEEIYRECLEAYPTAAIVVRNAMEFFAALGRPEEATAIVKKAYELEPANRDLRIGYALRQQQAGDLAGAEETLRAGTELENPLARAQALQDLANFYGDLERFDDAVGTYEQAYALIENPSPSFLFDFGDLLVRAGKLDRAMEIASDIRVRSQADMLAGRVHLARGEPERALERFSQGLRLWPNNGIARYFAAVAAEQSGLFDRAIEEYRYAIRVDPNATDARVRLGRILSAEGHANLALAALQHARGRAEPDLEAALLELEVVSGQREVRGVPEAFGAAIRRAGARGRAIAAIARGTWDRAGPEAALELLRGTEALDLSSPANAPVLRIYADAALAAGDADEVVRMLETKIPESDRTALVQALLGRARIVQGDLESGRAALEAALALDPDQGEALAARAGLLADDDPDAALALYDRGLARGDELADSTRSQLARGRAALLARLGRLDDAIAQLESHLESQPLDVAAARQLAEIYASRGAAGDGARSARLAQRANRFDADRRRREAEAAVAKPEDAPETS